MNRSELPTTSGRRRVPRRTGLAAVTGLAAIALALLMIGGAGANPVSGAVSTTDNPTWTDTYDLYANQACLNGQGVNCNIYVDKRDVWLSGLPVQASLGAGTYFFAVLSPGGQPDPNDCAPFKANGNDAVLSDTTPCNTNNTGAGDTWQNRTFSVGNNGTIAYPASGYPGGHDFDTANNKIQLFPYDDTPNPGGVYILAVCQVPLIPTGSPGVDPRDCKYDAFKVKEAGPPPETPPAAGASTTKDANGAYTTTYTWGLTKTACAHGITPCTQTVDALSGSVSFDYTVKLTEDGGTNSGVQVTGTISVFNPNADASNNVVPMDINSLTDSVSDGTTSTDCTVTGAPSGGSTVTLITFQTDFAYQCDLNALPTSPLSNTVNVGWPAQDLNLSGDPGNLSPLAAGTSDFTFSNVSFTQTLSGNCITVTDNFNNAVTPDTLGTFCADGTNSGVSSAHPAVTASWSAPTWTLTYSRSVSVVADQCKAYQNTATFSGADFTSGLKRSDSATVNVCGPASGGLTMGFWQNKNGQGIITAANQSNFGTWLRGFHPFSDAPSSGLATYVYNIIKAATCSSSSKTCNSMLRAQMLATALNVYFSNPALGGDPIAKFNGGNTVSLGSVNVDLTKICKMIDGSGGTASCSGSYQNASAQFGGANCLTVLGMLQYQNTSDPAIDAGAVWYGQIKSQQVVAKDAFDATNNQVSFTC